MCSLSMYLFITHQGQQYVFCPQFLKSVIWGENSFFLLPLCDIKLRNKACIYAFLVVERIL